MKPITFEQWFARFDVKQTESDEIEDVCSSPDDYIFYDNGAVADFDQNFVVKADQMRRKP